MCGAGRAHLRGWDRPTSRMRSPGASCAAGQPAPSHKLPRRPHAPVQPPPPPCSLFTPAIHTSAFARPPRRAARPMPAPRIPR
eukprot:521601-Prymnesium_polylepis.1